PLLYRRDIPPIPRGIWPPYIPLGYSASCRPLSERFFWGLFFRDEFVSALRVMPALTFGPRIDKDQSRTRRPSCPGGMGYQPASSSWRSSSFPPILLPRKLDGVAGRRGRR